MNFELKLRLLQYLLEKNNLTFHFYLDMIKGEEVLKIYTYLGNMYEYITFTLTIDRFYGLNNTLIVNTILSDIIFI